MIEIHFLPEAKEDLSRLHAFVSEYSQDAAKRAISKILDRVDLLSENPEMGRVWDLDPRFRELVIRYGQRGYVVRYRNHKGLVVIVRIWHMLEER